MTSSRRAGRGGAGARAGRGGAGLTAAEGAAGLLRASRLLGLSGAVHSWPCQAAGRGRLTRVGLRAGEDAGPHPGCTALALGRRAGRRRSRGERLAEARRQSGGAFGKRRALRAGGGAAAAARRLLPR